MTDTYPAATTGIEFDLGPAKDLLYPGLANVIQRCIAHTRATTYADRLELLIHERVAGRLPGDLVRLWGYPVIVVHDDEGPDLTIRMRPPRGADDDADSISERGGA